MTTFEAFLLTLTWSIVLLFLRPTIGHCPSDWYVNGVRPGGAFGCRPVPPPEPAVRGHEQDPPPRNDPEIFSRIDCDAIGQEPIVVNYTTVGCEMRH